MPARTGFTLLDLMITSAILVCIGGYTLLLVDHAQETANRVKCASNLRMIGQALLLYSNENRGAFPRTNYDPATADKPVAFTSPQLTEGTDEERAANINPAYYKGGLKPNDVSAALFRLIRREEITAEVFRCPSVQNATTQPVNPPDVGALCNFSDPRQLDYSYANPYPNENAADAGYKLHNMISAEFAVVADLNPGVDELLTMNTAAVPEDMRKVNSTNHDGDGQNVLYGDGHVEFQNNPFVGMNRDNIYTYGFSGQTTGGDGIVGSPSNEKDSVLLPTARTAATTQPTQK